MTVAMSTSLCVLLCVLGIQGLPCRARPGGSDQFPTSPTSAVRIEAQMIDCAATLQSNTGKERSCFALQDTSIDSSCKRKRP